MATTCNVPILDAGASRIGIGMPGEKGWNWSTVMPGMSGVVGDLGGLGSMRNSHASCVDSFREIARVGRTFLASSGERDWLIEGSTDLRQRQRLGTRMSVNGRFNFTDPAAAEHASRFYRLSPLP
jgi:hypothetical protein